MSGVNSELSIYTLYKKFDDYLGLSGGTVSGHVTFETYIEAKDDIRVGDSGCRISKGGIFHGSGVDVDWKIESPSIFLTGKKDGLVKGRKGDIDFITAEISDKSLYDTDIFKTITPFRVRNNIVDFFHIVANDKENYDGALSALRIELINENDYFANNFLSTGKGKAINITANANKVRFNSDNFFINDVVEINNEIISLTHRKANNEKIKIAQIHAYSDSNYKYFNFSTDTFKFDTSNVMKNNYNPTYNNNIRFNGRLNIWSRDADKKIFEMGSDWIKTNNLIKYNKDLFKILKTDESQLQDNTLIYKQYVDKQINTINDEINTVNDKIDKVNSNIGTEIGKATGDFVTREALQDNFSDLYDKSIINKLSVESVEKKGEDEDYEELTIVLGTSDYENYLTAIIPPADIDNSGVVSIEEQHFNGTKTFEDGIKVDEITTINEDSNLNITSTKAINFNWGYEVEKDNSETEVGITGTYVDGDEKFYNAFKITSDVANFAGALSIKNVSCLDIKQEKNSENKVINTLSILNDVVKINDATEGNITITKNCELSDSKNILLNNATEANRHNAAITIHSYDDNEYYLKYTGYAYLQKVEAKNGFIFSEGGGYYLDGKGNGTFCSIVADRYDGISYTDNLEKETSNKILLGTLKLGDGENEPNKAKTINIYSTDTKNTVGATNNENSKDLYLVGVHETSNNSEYEQSYVLPTLKIRTTSEESAILSSNVGFAFNFYDNTGRRKNVGFYMNKINGVGILTNDITITSLFLNKNNSMRTTLNLMGYMGYKGNGSSQDNIDASVQANNLVKAMTDAEYKSYENTDLLAVGDYFKNTWSILSEGAATFTKLTIATVYDTPENIASFTKDGITFQKNMSFYEGTDGDTYTENPEINLLLDTNKISFGIKGLTENNRALIIGDTLSDSTIGSTSDIPVKVNADCIMLKSLKIFKDDTNYKVLDESMVHYVTSAPTSATGYNDGDIIMVYE